MFIFDILKQGIVQNFLQVGSCGVYISLRRVSRLTTTEQTYVTDINHTTLEGDIGYIYYGTLVDNQNYNTIRLLEKKDTETVQKSGKTIYDFFGCEKIMHATYKVTNE